MLHSKSQSFDIFINFKIMIENQLGISIKAIQIDNAREFIHFLYVLS